jgi:autotransporter-associated beta strand protein
LLSTAWLAIAPQASAVDGTWTQATSGTQQWGTGTNWLNGIIADGVGANAIFNVNLTADQTIGLGASGRTIGNLFVRDTTLAAPDGGFALGVAGDGPITLDVTSGRAVIAVAQLQTSSAKKLAVVVPIVNNDGILKIGAGQLSIRADSPNLTGDFVAAGGLTDTRSFLNGITALQVTGQSTFQVDFASNGGTNVSNLVNSAAPLTLGGEVNSPFADIPPSLPLNFSSQVTGNSTLTVTGKAANANSQTFASTALRAGIHTINVANGGAGSSATLNLGAITRSAAATVNFVQSGAGTSTITTTTANGSGTILGGWAIVNNNTWAVSAGDGINPGAITGLATFATDTWSPGSNTDVTTSIASAIGDTNSVRFNTAAANTVTLTGPSTITSGGILNTVTVAGNASLITGGSLTSGTSELVIHQANNTANGTLTIASTITNNAGVVSVTKEGAGIAILGGTSANTYTGTTTVTSGVLQLNKTAGVDAVGGDIVITGNAQLHLLAAEQIPNTATITFTGTSTDSVPTQTGQETVANVIVNAVPQLAASVGQFIMRNNFTITGTATVNTGIFAVASSNNATVNAINMTSPNAIVRIAASGGASTLTVGPGGITSAGGDIQVKFNTNNQDGKLVLGGNFTSTGNATFSNAGYTGVNVNAIELTGTRTFDIGTGTTTTVQPDIIGVGGLTKAGNGTLTLTNLSAGSFTGPTTINAGALLVNGSLSATSEVDVASGGTLGGTGSITTATGGDVNLLVGGALAPGASAGTLTVNLSGGGELDLTAGIASTGSGALRFELATVPASDKITLTGGSLNIGVGSLDFGDFSFTTLAGFDTGGTYTLFDGSLPIVGTLGGITTGFINGQMFQLQLADGSNDLVVAPVPEPATAVMSIAAFSLLALRRRRTSGV